APAAECHGVACPVAASSAAIPLRGWPPTVENLPPAYTVEPLTARASTMPPGELHRPRELRLHAAQHLRDAEHHRGVAQVLMEIATPGDYVGVDRGGGFRDIPANALQSPWLPARPLTRISLHNRDYATRPVRPGAGLEALLGIPDGLRTAT